MIVAKTLKELQTHTSAFNSFTTIEDSSIPDYYKHVFPLTCECGAEMIITEPGHTQMQCCNPNCHIKSGHRLAHFCATLGYKGFGEQSCLSLLRANKDRLKYCTFLSAFLLTDTELSEGLSEYYVWLFNDIKNDLQTRAFYFTDAIAALGIPNVGQRSALFDVVRSPVVLLEYLLKDKTNVLCDMAGIQALSTRFYLSAFKVDVVTLMKDVMPNILDMPKGEIYVAITGKVSVNGVSYTRSEFIDLCESITDANGVQQFKLVETKAESKLQYVIADVPSTSDKYSIGLKLNKLVTANAFFNELQKIAGVGESTSAEEEKEIRNE